MKVEQINKLIKEVDSNLVSDSYHTFGELYEHRIVLYITLLKALYHNDEDFTYFKDDIWMTTTHSDETVWEGWFILGFMKEKGEQITYHLPINKWDECAKFATIIEKAPEYDGHTPDDVLERLKRFYK